MTRTETSGTDPIDIDALLRTAGQRLRTAGIDAPQTDARLLLAHAWDCELKDVALHALRGSAVPREVAELFEALIARRAAREPVQHITGRAPFRHLDMAVGPGVFIPRPETELLVDLALQRLRDHPVPTVRILDLCAGSGAIGLALATEVPGSRVTAVERSTHAAGWARLNGAELAESLAAVHSTWQLVEADVRSLPEVGEFDIVVANPPYVIRETQPAIPEVIAYDPPDALYGGGVDGLELPAAVVRSAASVLAPGGWVAVEHAEPQGPGLRGIMRAHGLIQSLTHQDYTGRDRFTCAELPSEES